jgi:hypothetical protein
VIYSVGWELDARERDAIELVPEPGWPIGIDTDGEVRERRADHTCADPGCGHRTCWTEQAHVAELTTLLREGPHGDQHADLRPPGTAHPAAQRRPTSRAPVREVLEYARWTGGCGGDHATTCRAQLPRPLSLDDLIFGGLPQQERVTVIRRRSIAVTLGDERRRRIWRPRGQPGPRLVNR